MESFFKFFESPGSFSSIFQIGLDLLILGLFTAVMIVRKPRVSKKDEEVMKSFEKIVEETAAISQGFEKNLENRQELLQQITSKLDQRIQEAQSLCTRLEHLSQINIESRATQNSSPAGQRSQNTDQQKVLLLARKGLSASEIAKNLKRPVGEIELILNLRKIAS